MKLPGAPLALLALLALLCAALVLAEGRKHPAQAAPLQGLGPAVPGKPALYTTASGQRWRVTRTAGAVPSSTYEQSYARLDQLGPRDEVLQTINFEERAWIQPDGPERTWVDFFLDERGELQVLQRQKPPSGAVKTVRFVWNGTGFDRGEPRDTPRPNP
jgi:hypothetical protein